MNMWNRWLWGVAALALALGAETACAADPAWPDSVARANVGQKRYDRWCNDYHEAFVYKIFLKQKLKPEIKATLDQALEIMRRVHVYSGGMHQIVYLVGWQHDGHDSMYPSWDVVGPQCRSSWSDDPTASLRELMRKGRAYNADVSLHICMNDAYTNSPLWQTYVDNDLICREADGSLAKGGVWGGERSYGISHVKEFRSGFAQKRILRLLDMLPELRDTHTIHVDALYGIESKYEKIGIQEDVEAIGKMVDFWHAQGMDVTTEFLPALDQIGVFPFFYHLNLDERLKTLCPPDVVCGGAGYNTRNTQNHYNKDWRGMMPLPGCVYEMAWGVAHWGDMTGLALNDPRRMVERLFEKPLLYAYYNRSRVVRHVEDTENYRVERANGVVANVRMRDRALTVSDNGRTVVSDDDYFLDFPRDGGLMLAWSAKGCDRVFRLPSAYAGAKALAGRTQPDGAELSLDVKDGAVRLNLPARTGAVLKPRF